MNRTYRNDSCSLKICSRLATQLTTTATCFSLTQPALFKSNSSFLLVSSPPTNQPKKIQRRIGFFCFFLFFVFAGGGDRFEGSRFAEDAYDSSDTELGV